MLITILLRLGSEPHKGLLLLFPVRMGLPLTRGSGTFKHHNNTQDSQGPLPAMDQVLLSQEMSVIQDGITNHLASGLRVEARVQVLLVPPVSERLHWVATYQVLAPVLSMALLQVYMLIRRVITL